jgi:hypothetical protein
MCEVVDVLLTDERVSDELVTDVRGSGRDCSDEREADMLVTALSKLSFCFQFGVSGSGIRCLFAPWILDPGWVKSQDPDLGSGSWMNNPNHISLELRNHFLGLKYLNFLMWIQDGSGIRDGKKSDPGWKNIGSEIRHEHPGSATLSVFKVSARADC